MTLIFADGFEDGVTNWVVGGGTFNIGAGRFGNGLVAAGLNAAIGFAFPSGTAGPYIVGMAYKPKSALGVIGQFWRGGDKDYGHTVLVRNAAGAVVAQAAAVLGTSAAGILPADAWSYVEVKTYIHDTTGFVVVRVNGVEVLNLQNVDTRDQSTTTTSGFMLGSVVSGVGTAGVAFDDVYACDTNGTYNNDFLGELVVEHLRPVSDDTAQWVGSDGNSTDNWNLVDEAGAYNGTDYVASSTVGLRDLYTVSPSARNLSAPVAGVMVSAVAMKTDAGVRTVKLNLKEGAGGTLRQSPEMGLPGGFGELKAAFPRKADGSQFTVADVNNLRFGIEVTS